MGTEPSDRLYDRIGVIVESHEPAEALRHAGGELVAAGRYHEAFDAETLLARVELGLPILKRLSDADYTADQRTRYEERIASACRTASSRFLKRGEFAPAYQYASMIGEFDEIRKAVDLYRYDPEKSPDERLQEVIEIALGQAVHSAKGIELTLRRSGICPAITATENVLLQDPDRTAREQCVKLLVRKLHAELIANLVAEITRIEGKQAVGARIEALLDGRPKLFENDAYHIDTSHLHSIVRMARILPKCDEVLLAAQLCEYGRRLSPNYKHDEGSPFHDPYVDGLLYFTGLAGSATPKALETFRGRADDSNPDVDGTYPVEIYVGLLAKLGRFAEAASYAETKLSGRPIGSNPACPGVNELWLSAGDPNRLAESARKRGDLLSYLAGKVLARTARSSQSKPSSRS
jgi:hypothetical protein